MLIVSVRERGKEEHPFTFDKQVVTIGRLRINDVILPKRNISKKHASLEITSEGVLMTDGGSTNGTYLNGKRIVDQVYVKPGDKIFMGDYIIQVRVEDNRSMVDGRAPMSRPVSDSAPDDDDIKATMADMDNALLEQQLEKYGVNLNSNAGPTTQVMPAQNMGATPPPIEDLGDEGFDQALAELVSGGERDAGTLRMDRDVPELEDFEELGDLSELEDELGEEDLIDIPLEEDEGEVIDGLDMAEDSLEEEVLAEFDVEEEEALPVGKDISTDLYARIRERVYAFWESSFDGSETAEEIQNKIPDLIRTVAAAENFHGDVSALVDRFMQDWEERYTPDPREKAAIAIEPEEFDVELEDEDDEHEQTGALEDEAPTRITPPAAAVPRVQPRAVEGLRMVNSILGREDVRDALVIASGVVVPRNRKGKLLPWAENMGLAELSSLVNGKASNGSAGSFRLESKPDQQGPDGWVSYIAPPLAVSGPMVTINRASHERVSASVLVKDGIMSGDQAKSFVRVLTKRSSLLITGNDVSEYSQVLASAIGHLPGKPRFMAIGPGVPELGGEHDRSRLDVSMGEMLKDPEAFVHAIELFQPDWLIASPCTSRSLLALLAASVTTQVPLVAVCRLSHPTKLLDLLTFVDRREARPLASQGVTKLMALADPLVLLMKEESGSHRVSGLFDVLVKKASGEVEIQARN